jgi:hypothetical protein
MRLLFLIEVNTEEGNVGASVGFCVALALSRHVSGIRCAQSDTRSCD